MSSVGKRGTKRKLDEGDEDDENHYSRRRESVFNISMCKLNRYRQIPDPSLRRSVLICNTLRYIEREMEGEGLHTVASSTVGFLPSIQTDDVVTLDPIPVQTPHNGNLSNLNSLSPSSPLPNGIDSSTQVTLALEVQSQHIVQDLRPITEVYPTAAVAVAYGKNLAELDSSSGRATPYPSLDTETCRIDSGALWNNNDSEDRLSSINWSTVLNFSSQSELDYGGSNSNTTTATCTFVGSASSGPSSSAETTMTFGGGSPSSSSSGSEIFGDIDLSLYDFDLLPLSPPNVRFAPLSAEELLRTFPNNETISPVPANGCFKNEFHGDELDNIMHILVGM